MNKIVQIRNPCRGGRRRSSAPAVSGRRCRRTLPPRSTINDYFQRWDYDGTLDRIHHTLDVQCREHAGREASPTAAIIDSQSVKSVEKGALDQPGGL